ncbi:MAG: hypothetical protein QOI63_695, partial [Thermoplasmata archaeon]|nr:hypothetical protein [Thermoplasmata archaeon]
MADDTSKGGAPSGAQRREAGEPKAPPTADGRSRAASEGGRPQAA